MTPVGGMPRITTSREARRWIGIPYEGWCSKSIEIGPVAACSPRSEQECRSEENRNAGRDGVHERPGVTLWTGCHHHADPERDDQQQEEENNEDHSELSPHRRRLPAVFSSG
jgi:hypothetical protein